ncbi:MAG: 8-oxoguanine deaminase [Acidimicrobiia bacterium]|nr:8-oxoguanine deaminase [Acidimicrobiia bacterium]
MSSLLIRNALVLVTMDDGGTEIAGGGLMAEDGWITQVGASSDLPGTADTVIDADGMVVVPGLINTHHHLYQTLTRAIPRAQDADLFTWLVALYPLWARLTSESIRDATTLGLAELAMSGCTTAFDHQYLWPNGSTIDDQFEGAEKVPIRFIASRGSMSLGESSGGLPPDAIVEGHESILEASQEAVARWHDPDPGSMRQVVLAPASPFSVTGELMKESAALARELGVRLHTHIAETIDEEAFCLERFGARPVEYAEQLDWLGDDVWFAHGVHISAEESEQMARTKTGVAHCPTSNMRLASGIAPIARYRKQGVPVGLGVDGSASNDSSNLLAEVRQAMLVARLAVAPGVGEGGALMSARDALRMATRGSAEVLGRSDLGSLEVGKACDVIAIDVTSRVGDSGFADPVAGLVFANRACVDWSVVHGRVVVEGGNVVGLEGDELRNRHTSWAKHLLA